MPTYSRCKHGTRPDLGSACFRSGWEANYARYLNWMISRGEIASWKYEPRTFWFDTIKRGTRSYLPDFEIVTNAGAVEYVEVKGWMDAKSKTKLARMARYYPAVVVRVVGAKEYRQIEAALSKIIPRWE